MLPAAIGAGLLFGGLDNGYGGAAVLLSAVILALWQVALAPPSPRIAKALAPLLGLVAVAALWGWHATVNGHGLAPDLVRHEIIELTGGLLTFMLAASVGYRRHSVQRDLDWIVAMLIVVMVTGFLLRLADGALPFWDRAMGSRFTATLNNANVAAGAAATLALLATARLMRRGRADGAARLLDWVAIICGWSAIVFSGSRTTIVAAGALTAMLFALHAAHTHRRQRRGIILALVATILFLFLLSTPVALLINDRFAIIQDGAVGRWLTWSHYGEIAMASPLYGYGLGGFPMLAERYPGPLSLAQQLWMVNSPHNILLHLMLQAGWPYLLCHVAAAAIVVWTIVRAALMRGLRTEVAGPLAAGVAILANAMVDILLEVPATSALFLLLIGLVYGQAVRRG